jgi:hypothetical protein
LTRFFFFIIRREASRFDYLGRSGEDAYESVTRNNDVAAMMRLLRFFIAIISILDGGKNKIVLRPGPQRQLVRGTFLSISK